MNFISSKFVNCDFIHCNFNNFFTDNYLFTDCKFSTKINLTKPSLFDVNKSRDLKLNKEILSEFYFALRDSYKAGNNLELKGINNYLAKKYNTKYNLKNPIKKIKGYVFEILLGYGEKPIRMLISCICLIIIFSFIYMFIGLRFTEYSSESDTLSKIINYDFNFPYYFRNILNPIYYKYVFRDYISFLYFSIVTFTTVGYGDITPINWLSRLISGIEMISGVTFIGGWVAAMFNKLLRK